MTVTDDTAQNEQKKSVSVDLQYAHIYAPPEFSLGKI